MSLLSWVEDPNPIKPPDLTKRVEERGLWTNCDQCGILLYVKHLKANQSICSSCGYHLQMTSKERIRDLVDFGTWCPFDETLSPCNPLKFIDKKTYSDRLTETQDETVLQDAILTGTGLIDDMPVALGVMDFNFMGGSMGSVVGEKITRLIEYATEKGLILILFCASGGARMQEGILSLMQMAKISSALQIYQSYTNLLYISVLTSPTTGGVTASFAMLGDLIIAEPNALIGFAGRRVIEQTFQEQLPDNFQTAEYLFEHGLLNLIIERCFLKQALSEIMLLHHEAPLKKRGKLPSSLHKPLNFLTEELVRRKSTFEMEKEQIQSLLLDKFETQPFILNKFLYESSLKKAEVFSDESSIVSTTNNEFSDLYHKILISLNCIFNQNDENLMKP